MNVAEKNPTSSTGSDSRSLAIARKARPVEVVTGASLSEDNRLLSELSLHILKLRHSSVSRRDLAFEILEVLETLMRFETNLLSLRTGLDIFIERLIAPPSIAAIIHNLFRWAREEVREVPSIERQDPRAPDAIFNEFDELIQWYLVRRENTQSLERLDRSATLGDAIFSLSLFHDKTFAGVLGFTVQTGLAIFGRAYEQLWLKVFLRDGEDSVLPRKGWESWVDDSVVFSGNGEGEKAMCAVLLPIVPHTQRFLADGIKLFLPYAALDLTPGKRIVTVHAALYDEKGDMLLEASVDDCLSMPAYGTQVRRLLSYQSLGIWPFDVVKGDFISDVSVVASIRPEARSAQEIVRVSLDLTLYDHRNEALTIELRFLTEDGDIIARRINPSGDTSLGAESASSGAPFVLQHVLHVTETVQRFTALELEVPLGELDWADVEYACMAEITVLGEHERVLCGMVSTFEIPPHFRSFGGLVGESQEREHGERNDKPLPLRQSEGFHVDVINDWDVDGEKALKFTVRFHDQQLLHRKGTAVLSLSEANGDPLLRQKAPSCVARAIRMPRASNGNGHAQEIVFLVPHREFHLGAPIDGEEPPTILWDPRWKVTIIGTDDLVLADAMGSFTLPQVATEFTAPASSHHSRAEDIYIADIEPDDTRQIPARRFKIYINFNCSAVSGPQYLLNLSVIPKGNGNAETAQHSVDGGSIIPLDLSNSFDTAGNGHDWFQSQHTVDFEALFKKCARPLAHYNIRIDLFNASGERLSSMQRSLGEVGPKQNWLSLLREKTGIRRSKSM